MGRGPHWVFLSGGILRYLGDDSRFYEKELPTAKERWGFDILGTSGYVNHVKNSARRWEWGDLERAVFLCFCLRGPLFCSMRVPLRSLLSFLLFLLCPLYLNLNYNFETRKDLGGISPSWSDRDVMEQRRGSPPASGHRWLLDGSRGTRAVRR